MSQSEIVDLCQRIYRKHQRALDLIYEYRPDLQAELNELLQEFVKEVPDLSLDYSIKSLIRFYVDEWDVQPLLVSENWTPSRRILLFEFMNFSDSLKLKLTLGPGDEQFRQNILNFSIANQPPFNPYHKKLNQKWNTLYIIDLLTKKNYLDTTTEDLEIEIRKKWSNFLQKDLPLIKKVFNEQCLATFE